MLKQQQAPPSRKPAMAPAQQQGSPGSPNGNLPPGGSRSQDRPGAGRGRNIVKGLQPPGSTCDVRVRNGSVYEGIFKTLSSKFELAVDAVHKKTSEQVVGPKREDIVDTMIFKPSDVAVVRFRNVDFNYATKDKFTDSAIATSSKLNGEHKDKILLRWDGGEGGNDDYDLDSDMSNGWDPNDMFKFNEDNYGVKTTYDSSLSSYTVPLEKDNTEEFRQREARATQLAREIESSPQYRARISIENDECRTEEEKHSSVQRPNSDRDSPSLANRDGKYIPLPQRVREGARGGGIRSSSSRGGRQVMSSMPVRGAPQHYPESSCSPEQRGMNGGPSRMSPKAQRPIRCTKTVSSPSSRPMEVPTSPSSAAPRAYPPLSPKSGSSLSCADSSLGTSIPDPSVAPKPSSPNSSTPIMPGEGKDIAPPAAVKEQSRTPEQLTPCQVPKQPGKGLCLRFTAPQMYPYPMSSSVPGQQGKYRPKGSLPQRSDQPNSAPPIMQAAAAAGPPLVAATPYSPYISYSPQQFPGQPTMMQPMAHYPSQPMFAPMLQSNPRMITSGNHPQALVSSSNHQYPPPEQQTPQTLYAAVHQSYSHHAAQLHPQPASTPTQSQQQPQHANPSPVQHQTGQPPHMSSGQPQQNLYHTATLTATPPSLTPGPSAQSPQSSYPQQAVYAIHAHQQLQHSYTNMSHVAQAHVQTGISGAHPGAPHPPHPAQVMLLHPPQSHGGPPQAAIQQTSSPSQYTYIGHHQVQSHPPQQLPFHPPGN
ncbi:hypothetical protein XELAEV_18002195mg [Xenopus laevis]|nr:hypothetical protein XELAEV_18002195mg [Xenopus laevis]